MTGKTTKTLAELGKKPKKPNVFVTDYHDFSHPGTPREKRSALHIGDIYINGAECNECNYFIRSRNRHDYVTCKCGAISVDGGSHYCRRVGAPEKFKSNIIVLYNDAYKDDIEENVDD